MNLNGKITNPGELRTRVLLAPAILSSGSGSFQRRVPDTVHAVNAWAKWSTVHGSEVWTAAANQAIDPATVLIRYRSDLDSTWYISKDNGASWYELVGAPDDIQERHEYMELKVQRASAA
jgi:SPP1 family predicted phage head-tail adaptor